MSDIWLRRTVGLLFCYAGQKHDGHRVGNGRWKKDHRKCHTGENAILRERCFPERPEVTRQPGSRALSMLWRTFRRIRFSVSGRFKTASSRKVSYQMGPFFFEKNRNRAVFLRGPACARRTGRPSERDTKRVRRRQYRMQRQRQRGGLWKDRKAGKVGSAHAHELFQKAGKKKAVPSDSGQDTMPRDSCGSRRENTK